MKSGLAYLLLACAVSNLGCSTDPVPSPACAEAAGCTTGGATPPACSLGEQLCRRPLNIAHRGGGALAPENTLEAFHNAVTVGADVLETDVQATADGIIVCMHDETVDRTTNGTGRVSELTWAEVEALDAGDDFSLDGDATFPFRGKGVRVPTLDALLEAFPDRPFSIEIKQAKPSIVDDVLKILEDRNMDGRVIIASFYDEVLNEVRAKAPQLPTTFTLVEMLALNGLAPEDEADYQAPAPVVQAPLASVTDEYVARAHRLGLVAQAWTVDDRATMDSFLKLGVDGIITNDPQVLSKAIADFTPD